jgi:hypothetical protein
MCRALSRPLTAEAGGPHFTARSETVVLKVNGAYNMINKRVQNFCWASLDGFSMRLAGRYGELISLVTADQSGHHSLPRQKE